MATPEQKTQLAIIEWLSLKNPLAHKLTIRIGNEGKRTVGGHLLAIRMGLHVGASDLFIALPNIKYSGCFIEIKPDGWKGPSGKKMKQHVDRQLEFIELMKSQGYAGKLIVGVDEGVSFISSYLDIKLKDKQIEKEL